MKNFHISDVLSITTRRLVSSRHMDGVYDILNFLTGDNLYTHQLPRAVRECEPWLRSQFPQLFPDAPVLAELNRNLDNVIAAAGGNQKFASRAIEGWVATVRERLGLPEMLPVYEMGKEMHTHIDPLEEANAMFGEKRVIGIVS